MSDRSFWTTLGHCPLVMIMFSGLLFGQSWLRQRMPDRVLHLEVRVEGEVGQGAQSGQAVVDARVEALRAPVRLDHVLSQLDGAGGADCGEAVQQGRDGRGVDEEGRELVEDRQDLDQLRRAVEG